MGKSDATPIILAVAALLVAAWSFNENTKLHNSLGNCESEFKGFRDGVVYGR